MDLFYDLLLWLHIVAFAAGGAYPAVMPFLFEKLAGASQEETRAALFSIGNTISRIGRIAMVVLLITGPVLLWMRFGGLSGASIWFWVKMALIAVMLVSLVIGGINFKKAEKGDASGLVVAETAGRIAAVAYLGVLLAAVFAFS